MGRTKVSMANLQSKNAMFERRKKNLLKKASELSTLCDVDTCLIIFPPPHAKHLKVETFPQDPTHVIKRYQGYDEKQRKNKIYDPQVKSEASSLMDSFDEMGEDQFRMLVSKLDCKIEEYNRRIGMLMKDKVYVPMAPIQNTTVYEDNEMFRMGDFDDWIVGSPLVNLPDVTNHNENHFSVWQNALLGDNVDQWSHEPLADGSSHGVMESRCLQEKVFHSGLEMLI